MRGALLATMAGGLLAAGLFAAPAGATPSLSSAPNPPRAADAKPAGMTVVSQTAWVGKAPNDAFKMGLRLGPVQASAQNLSVTVYSQLNNRTNFDATLSGHTRGSVIYQQSVAVKSLPQANGAVQLTFPVGTSPSPVAGTPPGTLPPDQNVASSENFVYPMQIAATDGQGRTIGQPVITYLVWVPDPSGFPKLDVSLVLPVHAPPALTPTGAPAPLAPGTVSSLQAEAQVLAKHPAIPVTLAVTPQTQDALASDGKTGQATLAAWASAIKTTGDETLPSSYTRLNFPGMLAAGLGSEIGPQLNAGSATLSKAFGVAPDTSVGAVDGPVDQATAAIFRARGATGLILPNNDLSALPSGLQQNTFAQPTNLTGSDLRVVAADDGLRTHFTNSGDQVLQANQLLAELAMIETEQPSMARGVAVLPPESWNPTPAFLQTTLAGLAGNPLVSPVSGRQLFSIPTATNGGRGETVSRSLTPSGSATTAVNNPGELGALRAKINSLAVTVTGANSPVASMQNFLFVAQSSDLSDRQRNAAVAWLNRALGDGFAGLQLPKSISVTLTSNSGTVPITILNGPGTARVRLQLTSQKLTFRPFVPPGGSCQATSSSSETCVLTLSAPSTLLRLPVEARATGVFSLNLNLLSSDGSVVISHVRYTVRSTAISGVAVILTIGALVLLALWWFRDRRHGRRSRRLVPDPSRTDAAGHLPPLSAKEPTVSASTHVPWEARRSR